MDRVCGVCIYHTDHGCRKWECKGTETLESFEARVRADERRKVIEEMKKALKEDTQNDNN